jgi:hypothetical protein
MITDHLVFNRGTTRGWRRIVAAAKKSRQICANMTHSAAKICRRIPQVDVDQLFP